MLYPIQIISPPILLHFSTMSHPPAFSSDSDELDPSKIIEEFIAERDVLDSFARRLAAKIKVKLAAGIFRR